MIAAFTAARLWVRLNPRAALASAGAVAVIGLLLFVYLKGKGDAMDRERARDAIAAVEAVKTDARANEKAGDVLAADAANRAQAEKELTDAIADMPDSLPDPVAVRLGCERLRQAGVSVADLPACQPPRSGP